MIKKIRITLEPYQWPLRSAPNTVAFQLEITVESFGKDTCHIRETYHMDELTSYYDGIMDRLKEIMRQELLAER